MPAHDLDVVRRWLRHPRQRCRAVERLRELQAKLRQQVNDLAQQPWHGRSGMNRPEFDVLYAQLREVESLLADALQTGGSAKRRLALRDVRDRLPALETLSAAEAFRASMHDAEDRDRYTAEREREACDASERELLDSRKRAAAATRDHVLKDLRKAALRALRAKVDE